MVSASAWKNIEDLENSITLDELNYFVKALREKEHRMMKFHGALKGIDIDEGVKEENEERLERIRRRAEARLTGKTDADFERDDFADMGMDIEIVED